MKINKSDTAATGFIRHLLFHWRRGDGHRLRYLWNRLRWHVYPRLRWAGNHPDHVDLELSSACNMKCPMCYTTTSDFKAGVPHVSMPFALYKKVVDELGMLGTFSIRLSWRGEPTLNRHFVECVRYAKQRGIREVSSLTNALNLTAEMFEALVESQMDWLTISFDGLGRTYDEIRAPARFEAMMEKLRAFAEIKERKRSVKPVLRIQSLWPALRDNPAAFFEAFRGIADEVSVNALLDYLHHDGNIEYLERFTCPVPFQRMVIGSDGRAFMCINDELGRVPVGDVQRQTVREIWTGGPMQRVRGIHKEARGTATFESCRNCYLPRRTAAVPYRMGDRTVVLDDLVGRPQAIGA